MNKLLNITSSILFVMILIFGFNCKEQTKEKKKPDIVPIIQKFSPRHIEYFHDVDRQVYIGTEIPGLFSKMKEKSDTVCDMVWAKRKFNNEILHDFISPNNFSREPFNNWGHPLPKLIAGCWNFFKLNDTRPDLDFHMVNHFLPDQKKECFSVGFLQPYWMHTILKCEKLTSIDIDWRIHDAHYQLLQLFQRKEMGSKDQISEKVKSLSLGWKARFDGKPLEKVEKVDFNSICYAKFHDRCYQFLSDFQKLYSELLEVDLQTSALHDGDYQFLPDTVPVLFFSNAIEALYTTRSQFDEILKRVADGLGKNRKAIFIHHAAGQAQFGIYELKTSEIGEYEIQTLCKDKYDSSPVGETHVYTTHFEKITKTKTPSSCSNQDFLKSFR